MNNKLINVKTTQSNHIMHKDKLYESEEKSIIKEGCVFCRIVNKAEPAHIFWESEEFMAFLSIFPNTNGVSVVIPKKHYRSYAFDLPENVLIGLTLAARTVAKILDEKLDEVGRTGMVFEGFGIDHVHAKLFPLHGTGNMKEWQPIHSSIKTTFEQYPGYISSHDGPRADENQLKQLCGKLSENK